MLLFRLGALTDICKNGNLLKANSCNCTAEFDGPKKVVSMTIIKKTKMKEVLTFEVRAAYYF